jgi:translocation and assembly module TamA
MYFIFLIFLIVCGSPESRATETLPLSNIHITIRGVKDASTLANIEMHLKAVKTANLHLAGTSLATWEKASLKAIQEALKPFGYFKATIQLALHKHKNNSYKAIFTIDVGSRLRITSLQLQLIGEGQQDLALQAILQRLPVQQGDAMTNENYQTLKTFVYDTIVSEGYLNATWETHIATIDLKSYKSTVTLVIHTGKRYFIGTIHFNPTPFSAEFINRYLPFKSGDSYRLAEILHFQETLKNSQYFQQVLLKEPPKDLIREQTIPLEFSLTPAPKNRYITGVGVDIEKLDKLRIHPYIKLAWLARSVTTTGHKFSLNVYFSNTDQSVSGIYSIPGKQPAHQHYYIQLGLGHKTTEKFDTFTRQFGFIYNFQQAPHVWTTFIGHQTGYFENKTENTKTNFQFLIPGLTFNRRSPLSANNSQQYQLDFRLQGALNPLLSDTNFLQAECQIAYLLPFSMPNHFVFRVRLGHTYVEQLDRLPPSLLFYAGGRHLRGFHHQELGPGKSVGVWNGEYRQHLKGSFYLSLFLDAGNASHNGLLPLQQSAGTCFVWKLPIGILEVGVVKKLTNAQNTNWRFIFSFNTDFL